VSLSLLRQNAQLFALFEAVFFVFVIPIVRVRLLYALDRPVIRTMRCLQVLIRLLLIYSWF